MRMCRFLVACSSGPYRLRQATGATGETASSSPPASGCEASSSTGSRPTPAREAPTDTVSSAAARAGVSVTFPHLQFVVQGQDTRFANLPDDAVVPRPGALGPGALYLLHLHDRSPGEPFLKLGFLTLRRSGFAATGGRCEYADGLEPEPADPTLTFVKRFRIAERLVGPLPDPHVSGSVDGGRLSYDRPGWNVTAMAARPTHGGFEVSANREIGEGL